VELVTPVSDGTPQRAMTAGEEWKAHWPLVLAATAGFSLHPVVTYATGLFIEPLSDAFGWSRAQISVGLTITAAAMVFLSPAVGIVIDRWGTRRLAIWGTILTGCSIASFGLASGTMTNWVLLWIVFAIVSLAVKATVWTAAVSSVFTAGRGVALGVTLSGVAIAQILVPPLSYWLIEAYGWRGAYILLGLVWGAVALVPVVLFMFDAHDHRRKLRKDDPGAEPAPSIVQGMDIREALRSVVLWRIGIATLITMFIGIGAIVHLVPILTEAGVTRQNAAFLASLAGAAGIVGKLLTGWLMDSRDAGMIGSITLGVAAVGFIMLLEPFRASGLMIVAIAIIGYSAGAKLQIAAYLTGRYGGLRNFGKIFGVVASLVALGSGLGPLAAGAIYDAYGTYTPMLIAGIVGSLVSGLLIFGLGPYPVWALGGDAAARG
jgi:predicted MFS family arabinose efflux permease